jgi:hypothetical protein
MNYEGTTVKRPTGCPFVFLSWPVDTWSTVSVGSNHRSCIQEAARTTPDASQQHGRCDPSQPAIHQISTHMLS